MLPDALNNPETAALGLDVAALEGKTIAEIRRIVDRGDCALVIATEGVPVGLPAEVMQKEPDAKDGTATLSWMYQTDSGEWRDWYIYGVDDDYVRRVGEPPTEVILGHLYTRRARATPGMRVRPIATLNFDLKGICTFASDAAPQFDILRIRAEERTDALEASPTALPRMACEPDDVLDTLDRSFGFAPPAESIVIGDWDPHDPRTAGLAWINDSDLRALMLMNAKLDARLTIGREGSGPWWLIAREGATMWPSIPLDEHGLRVAFRGPAGEAGPALDVYAGKVGIRMTDSDGTPFEAAVFIAQRSSRVAPGPKPPAIQLLGHKNDRPAVMAPVTARVLEQDQKLEVSFEAVTKAFTLVNIRRTEDKNVALISARSL